ncbi:thiol:disulfide interchange protein DsbG [Salinisphaera sp. USBA-960]|uniref:thiol:disulfide interchange protein DsbG n=1 Tax=Salinisphaera orenii TaxID=856731 RepID=UPI000DBEA3FE|nr:thiol:disulfide interchange protein DsbG [Salifodinibacter halophilus]NNC26037.1 thiol:disulfide interchange protein DsbG [Salifodinibacter halophilus]
MIRVFFAAALIAGLLVANPAGAADDDVPAPVAALQKQGMKLSGTFETKGELAGYAANFKGQSVAIYVTPDGKRAIVGTMVDSQGRNLSAKPLQRLVTGSQQSNVWGKLAKTTWVADGADDAERIIYMFTDANCPYCHRFWQKARPWVNAGKVQIRHVLVGLLKPSSMPKAASILAADDPSKALDRSEHNYEDGGIEAMDNPPDKVVKKIGRNTDFMKSHGLHATPAIVYHNADGDVTVKQGVPQGEQLAKVMGSPKPEQEGD